MSYTDFCNHGSTAADLKVVAPLVFLHSIVVGEFHDKVVVLGPKTDHGFTPKSIVRATVRQIMHNVITLYVPKMDYSVINWESDLSNANSFNIIQT